jgi:hypothetical protein
MSTVRTAVLRSTEELKGRFWQSAGLVGAAGEAEQAARWSTASLAERSIHGLAEVGGELKQEENDDLS